MVRPVAATGDHNRTSASQYEPVGALTVTALVFALDDAAVFGAAVASAAGFPVGRQEVRTFEDGEHKARPLESVRGRDIFVVESLHGGPALSGDEKLVRLLFFIGALKDAGAGRVTVVAPYLAFLRKDQRTKARDPVTTRYLAELFEAMGTDVVVTLEAHNPAAFENAFRCRTEHLNARRLLASHVAGLVGGGAVAVVSPDPGGLKRAELFRECLETILGRPVAKGLCDKHRSSGVVTGNLFAGDVADREVIVADDMIATGGTLVRAAALCRKHGARRVHAIATHGLFIGGGEALFEGGALDTVTVTNSVPTFRLAETVRSQVAVIDVAAFLGEAIHRMHTGESVVDLLATE